MAEEARCKYLFPRVPMGHRRSPGGVCRRHHIRKGTPEQTESGLSQVSYLPDQLGCVDVRRTGNAGHWNSYLLLSEVEELETCGCSRSREYPGSEFDQSVLGNANHCYCIVHCCVRGVLGWCL
uniref:Uncharacterized protein n=1 Tax=Cacopsylla melanoneura TaxID=428564 RepID=A0A8D8LRW3_9HEMI